MLANWLYNRVEFITKLWLWPSSLKLAEFDTCASCPSIGDLNTRKITLRTRVGIPKMVTNGSEVLPYQV